MVVQRLCGCFCPSLARSVLGLHLIVKADSKPKKRMAHVTPVIGSEIAEADTIRSNSKGAIVNTTAEIEYLEQQLRQAMLSSDVETLNGLLSDRLLFTNQNGAHLTKLDDLTAHKSGLLSLEKLDILFQQVRVIDDSNALTWTTATLEGSYSGNAFSGTFAYTRLWCRTTQRWRVEMGHCSPML